MQISKFTMRPLRLLFAPAVAVAAALALTAAPANAEDRGASTRNGCGSASYQDHGEYMYLYDNCGDKRSVAVQMKYHKNGAYKNYWRWEWRGAGRWDRFNLNVDDGGNFVFRVCLGDHGAPGGEPANVDYSTCSTWTYVWAP